MSAALDLKAVVAELAHRHPVGDTLTDPLQQILWDNIGYLIDDQRRAMLFAEFTDRVGLTPQAIEAADGGVLLDIAQRGGMRPEVRVQRWRDIARLVQVRAGGDLAGTLKSLPTAKARTLLKGFPTIADPAADRILLFAALALTPSLESNGLRVLVRLGLLEEQHDYNRTYRAAVDLLAREGVATRDWLVSAYVALRGHGQALCKRATPNCLACPLDKTCAHAPASVL